MKKLKIKQSPMRKASSMAMKASPRAPMKALPMIKASPMKATPKALGKKRSSDCLLEEVPDSDEETDMHNVQPTEVAGQDKRQLPVSPNAEHLPSFKCS